MNKTDSILNTDTRPNLQRSTGVGDKELFLHRDQMQWTAVYLQGKFFMADPQSISKLVQIQAEIELEKKLAQDEELEERARGQSFHSYRHKIDEAEQSCVTEVDPKRQKLQQFKVEEELERQEELYLKRIAEARNKKKQEKKVGRNLVHFAQKEKEDFKSVKMEKPKEEEHVQDMQHSMAMKITPSKQNYKNQSTKKDKKERSSEKQGLINANLLKSSTKKEKVQEILAKSKKLQYTPASRKQEQRKTIQVNSIVQIHIDPIKVASPQSVHSKGKNQMMESQVVKINTQHLHTPKRPERSPSILSLKSEEQHKIAQQMVHCQRAGDRFFYQLHSKIDQLQQNIDVNKRESPSPKKDKSPPPLAETRKYQQRAPYKFQQSTVMINTKNLLKDLNKQLKQIGMIQPAEDSRITQEKHMSYISGIKLIEVEEENKQKNNEILAALNQEEKPTKQNKDLGLVNEVTIKIDPTIVKKQNASETIIVKEKDENTTLQNKSDHCKLISSLINQQILQVAPKPQMDKNKQQKQKLNEQISLLKQVINELRVQRVKYQTSVNDKNGDDCGTVYSNFLKTDRQIMNNNKDQLSHRVSPSIFNNFAESAVSQFHTNQYKSMATAKNSSGKIIKNYSPMRKMPKIEEERKSDIRQKQIKQEQFNETEQRETENHQNFSQQKSKQSQLMNIKDANSVKIPTGNQEVSHNYQENNTTKNLEIVNVNNSESVWAASHIKSKLLFNKSIAPTVNNSIKFQQDMQSSMPRPLNKHNHSQPPKFIIHEHDNHQKRHQSNFKKKVVNDFEQLQQEIKSNAKNATITQPALDPKKRATKEGKYKTIEAKTASYHPDLNKIVFNNAETNLKAKIVQIQQSQREKGFQSGTSDKKNSFHQSKSSKGFRLRRGSESSRQSRVSSQKKSQRQYEKPKQNMKQERSNVYVPALQEQNYVHSVNTSKQEQKPVTKQVQKTEQKYNYKPEKRRISFTQIQIPKIPQPPSPNIKIEEMAELIKSMSNILSLELRQGQLNRLIMKKYKNCIMLDLPNSQASKLVWHYNGKFYVGEWNESEMVKSGEGIQYIPQKYYYKGQFLNGKRNGSGIMIQESGSIYEGQWADGQKSGRGKYYDASIKLSYEGQWKNGKRQGFGYFSIENQSIYEGTFVQNLKDGYGTQSFYNQDSYKGQYSKGRFHGKGTYVWASGDSYQGQFYQGCKHGNGIWKSFIGEVYEGGYKNDKKTGNGKYKWGNGCFFEGEFEGDRKNGQGVLKYPDGREVQGIWKDGKLIQTFDEPRKNDMEQPLSPKKSRVVQMSTHIKVENKPHHSSAVQQRKH